MSNADLCFHGKPVLKIVSRGTVHSMRIFRRKMHRRHISVMATANPVTELLRRIAQLEAKSEQYFGDTKSLDVDILYHLPEKLPKAPLPIPDPVSREPSFEIPSLTPDRKQKKDKKRKRQNKAESTEKVVKKRKTEGEKTPKHHPIDPSLTKTMPLFRYTCCGCDQDHFVSAQSMAAHAARCSKYQEKNKNRKGPLKNTKQPVTKEWWDQHVEQMRKKGLNPYHPSSPFSRASGSNLKTKPIPKDKN